MWGFRDGIRHLIWGLGFGRRDSGINGREEEQGRPNGSIKSAGWFFLLIFIRRGVPDQSPARLHATGMAHGAQTVVS